MVSQKPINSAVKDDSAVILATNQDNITTNGNGIYGNAIAKKVSLEKTEQNRAASGAVNAIYGNAWNEGNCEYCNEQFKKKTTWQRFCCTDHQALAYEQRTGKKWYGGKKTVAG